MTEPTVLNWKTVLIDIGIVIIGGITTLLVHLLVEPTRRGFYCDDESIRYPYHDDTIPDWLAGLYSLVIAFVLISGTEFFTHRRKRTPLQSSVPVWIQSLYRILVDFLFGLIVTLLLTEVGKQVIGRLRPNFIHVCKPNINLYNCAAYGNRYIDDFICQNEANDDAKESRVSFPSGHSSFTAYSMMYTIIYIQLAWTFTYRLGHLRLLKGGVQVVLFGVVYFTGLSRVMDNKHHWSDVSGGALLGVVVAVLLARYLSNLRSPMNSIVQNKEVSKPNSRGDSDGAVCYDVQNHNNPILVIAQE